MKQKYIIAFCLIFSLLLLGCSEHNDSDNSFTIFESLDELYRANPKVDFKKSISTKDYRFIGVQGAAVLVPAAPECLYKQFDINIIIGTSDAIENYEHAKFQALAMVYAVVV